MADSDAAWATYLTPGAVHRRLGLVCLGVGFAGGRIAPVVDRTLTCWAAVLVSAGSGELDDRGTGRHRLTAPVVFWLRPGERHGYGPDAHGWDHIWVLFDGPAAGAYQELGYLPAPDEAPVSPLSHPAPVHHAFARLRAAAEDSDDPHTPAAAAVHDLLVTICRHGPHPAESDVVAALRRAATERIAVPEHARRLGLAEGALREVVRGATGLAPAEYLLAVRLTLAKDLLAGTDLTVAGVAHRVGYDDPAYFSRLFARRTGTAPSAFREQQRRERA